MISPRITRLILTSFRSYPRLDLAVDAAMVVLTGQNGAGKTNVLEALSLLTQGKGLRRADLEDMASEDGTGSFAVAVEVDGALGPAHLGTGLEGPEAGPRKYRVDRQPVSSAAAFADHLRLVWLTPSMDGLFAGSAGERRRFLDRLVLAVDAGHGARVNALERALLMCDEINPRRPQSRVGRPARQSRASLRDAPRGGPRARGLPPLRPAL